MTRLDFGLTSDIYQLGEFVVAGEREGQALAITLQRQAMNVKNVVAADAYGSLNGNPGDLLQRLPGVEGVSTGGEVRFVKIRGMDANLNTVTVDGNRMANTGSADTNRSFQLQTLVEEGIERMEVIKSPTPDMDADSIGGAVNMVTGSAFDRSPERRIRLLYGATTRPRDDRDEIRPHYSMSYSEVFAGRLGVALNYGHRQQLSAQDRTTQQHSTTVDEPYFTRSLELFDFRNTRTRWGGNLKLDYRLSDQTRFFANTSMNKHYEHANHASATFQTRNEVATPNGVGGFTGRGTILPGWTNSVTEWRGTADSTAELVGSTLNKDAQTWHYQLGAVHDFGALKVDYDGYHSDSDTEYVNQGGFRVTAPGVGMRLERDPSQPFWPQFTQTEGPDIYDINNYTDNLFNIVDMNGRSVLQGLALNARYDFSGPVPAFLKAGLRLREETRDRDSRPQQWKYIGPDLGQFVNTQYRYDFDDRYPQYADLPVPTRPFREKKNSTDDHWGYDISTALREAPERFEENVVFNTTNRLANQAEFEERVSAAYLMGNVELGRLSILGGLRAEETRTSGQGALQIVTPEERARRNAWVGPVTPEEARRRIEAELSERFEAEGKYTKVFPGIHLRFEPVGGLLARASYATNIGRPNISTLIPRTTIDLDNQRVVTNNPNLRPQFGDNFDVGFEYYFEPVGMLSAGVFLKEISDFIFTDTSQTVGSGPDNGFGGAYEGFALQTQANGGRARVRGLELGYQQQFTFLPGWLSGFSVFANYTRLETRGDYGGSVVRSTNDLAGFVPETANFGVSYLRGGHSVRLQFNHVGKWLQSFSTNEALLLYRKARSALDIKTVFRVNRNFDVWMDVWNVFAEGDNVNVRYNGRPGQLSKMHAQVHFGVSARL